jgi:hypothetical protein
MRFRAHATDLVVEPAAVGASRERLGDHGDERGPGRADRTRLARDRLRGGDVSGWRRAGPGSVVAAVPSRVTADAAGPVAQASGTCLNGPIRDRRRSTHTRSTSP